jgi:hypothetical protein
MFYIKGQLINYENPASVHVISPAMQASGVLCETQKELMCQVDHQAQNN